MKFLYILIFYSLATFSQASNPFDDIVKIPLSTYKLHTTSSNYSNHPHCIRKDGYEDLQHALYLDKGFSEGLVLWLAGNPLATNLEKNSPHIDTFKYGKDSCQSTSTTSFQEKKLTQKIETKCTNDKNSETFFTIEEVNTEIGIIKITIDKVSCFYQRISQ